MLFLHFLLLFEVLSPTIAFTFHDHIFVSFNHFNQVFWVIIITFYFITVVCYIPVLLLYVWVLFLFSSVAFVLNILCCSDQNWNHLCHFSYYHFQIRLCSALKKCSITTKTLLFMCLLFSSPGNPTGGKFYFSILIWLLKTCHHMLFFLGRTI